MYFRISSAYHNFYNPYAQFFTSPLLDFNFYVFLNSYGYKITFHYFIFSVIGLDKPATMRIYTGLTTAQFEYVFRCVSPSLLGRYKNIQKGKIALYTYIMKVGTNHSNAEIAPLFGVTKEVISLRIRAVRDLFHGTYQIPLVMIYSIIHRH